MDANAKEQIKAGLMAFINEKPDEAKAAFNKALEIKMRAAMAAGPAEKTTEVVGTPTDVSEDVAVDTETDKTE